MAAETLTGTRAADGFPAYLPSGSGELAVAYGSYAVTAAVEDGDIWELCKLPANSTIIGGFFLTTDGDTGAESLDIDLGWAANGAEEADPDGLVNAGVLTGDAITDLQVAGWNRRPFTVIPGATTFTAETTIQAEANAAAATHQNFTLSCVVYYVRT